MATWKKIVTSGSLATQLNFDGTTVLSGSNSITIGGAPSATALGGSVSVANILKGSTVFSGSGQLTSTFLEISGDNVVSSSAQIVAGLPAGTVSASAGGSTQGSFTLNGQAVAITDLGTDGDPTFDTITLDAGGIKGAGVFSGSAQLPSGLISASAGGSTQGAFTLNGQAVSITDLGTDGDPTFDTITLDAGGIKGAGVISGSGGIAGLGASIISSSAQLPSGLISASAGGSTQGSFELNGQAVAITNLGTTGTPTFGATTLGNTTINGDLTVEGNTVSVGTTNTEVADQLMYFNSGSDGNKDSGFIVHSGSVDDKGSAFYHDTTDQRWSVAKTIAKDATAITPLQYVTTVKKDTSNPDTTSGSYGAGEMQVNTSTGDIWIRTTD